MTFLAHSGYLNWGENVVSRMSTDPLTAIRGTATTAKRTPRKAKHHGATGPSGRTI